ncbi:hypothetical protein E2562_032241 [Oryza meyeriana var. granulata]|uniref:Uncharacterized protein n=1 Tax=Oryza meyeriana var. granulata TaxID=110450 RepID=A0A6G1DBV7_9ORYZ|nr:hypothetical protein E2562_032241 [Oryza meyeriana var. granulata]
MAIASLARILLGPESSRARVAIAVAWSSMVKIWVGDGTLMPRVASPSKSNIADAWSRFWLGEGPVAQVANAVKPELAEGGAEGRLAHEDIVLKQMQLQLTELRVWIKEERRKDDRKAACKQYARSALLVMAQLVLYGWIGDKGSFFEIFTKDNKTTSEKNKEKAGEELMEVLVRASWDVAEGWLQELQHKPTPHARSQLSILCCRSLLTTSSS